MIATVVRFSGTGGPPPLSKLCDLLGHGHKYGTASDSSDSLVTPCSVSTVCLVPRSLTLIDDLGKSFDESLMPEY